MLFHVVVVVVVVVWASDEGAGREELVRREEGDRCFILHTHTKPL